MCARTCTYMVGFGGVFGKGDGFGDVYVGDQWQLKELAAHELAENCGLDFKT
jgi:hypothetical protein